MRNLLRGKQDFISFKFLTSQSQIFSTSNADPFKLLNGHYCLASLESAPIDWGPKTRFEAQRLDKF